VSASVSPKTTATTTTTAIGADEENTGVVTQEILASMNDTDRDAAVQQMLAMLNATKNDDNGRFVYVQWL
jgi:hypothetical protein